MSPCLCQVFATRRTIGGIGSCTRVVRQSIGSLFVLRSRTRFMVGIKSSAVTTGGLFKLKTDLVRVLSRVSRGFILKVDSRSLRIAVGVGDPNGVSVGSGMGGAAIMFNLVLLLYNKNCRTTSKAGLTASNLPNVVGAVSRCLDRHRRQRLGSSVFAACGSDLRVGSPRSVLLLLGRIDRGGSITG